MPRDLLPQVELGPPCRHLRSKGMYVTGLIEPQHDPIAPMGDGHCWCNHTQHVMGPDQAMVDRQKCDASRACYEKW